MNVDEFLSDLYNDELSDMFIGNRNSKEEPRGKLLPLLNKAMTQAYAKYDVVIKTVMLPITSDEKLYDLTDPDLTDPDPALDPLAVIAVINSYGRELTPAEARVLGNTIYFPNPTDTTLQVVYKEKPVRFTEEQDDEEVILNLPTLLVPWASSWVAARFFLGQKDEAARAKGAELLTLAGQFEAVFSGTNTTNESTHEDANKFCARGFA